MAAAPVWPWRLPSFAEPGLWVLVRLRDDRRDLHTCPRRPRTPPAHPLARRAARQRAWGRRGWWPRYSSTTRRSAPRCAHAHRRPAWLRWWPPVCAHAHRRPASSLVAARVPRPLRPSVPTWGLAPPSSLSRAPRQLPAPRPPPIAPALQALALLRGPSAAAVFEPEPEHITSGSAKSPDGEWPLCPEPLRAPPLPDSWGELRSCWA